MQSTPSLMNILSRVIIPAAITVAVWPFPAPSQTKSLTPSENISKIIYSNLSKPEMLKQLSVFVNIGDKLKEFPSKTGLEFDFCFGGGPGVVDCHLSSGLQLVADPDGLIQIIRREAKVVGGVRFNEISISANILRWNGYVRGYPE
jgi:hypothetical protein